MSTKGKLALLILIILLAVTILYLVWPQNYTSETRTVIGTVQLPAPQLTGSTSVEKAIYDRRSVRRYTNQSLTLQDVEQLMWAAQGITNTTTGFRAAPSAGATYPLEIYILVGNRSVNGLNQGLYHFNPYNNTLEQILGNDARPQLSTAANGQPWVEQAPVDIIITGNYQKMIDKYKDETLSTRFVNMEAGHAGENIYLEAGARGLVTVALGSFKDDQVHQILTIPSDESTLYIFPVGHSAL